MKIIISILVLLGFLFIVYYGSQHNVDVTWIVKPKSTNKPQPVETDSDIHDAVNFVK